MSFTTLYLLTYVLGIVNADDTLLVQTRLAVSNTTGSSPPASTAAQTYRFVFTKTWGSDHSCLTEIEFLDAYKKQLIAKYKSQTSCYGCAISCDECEENYGNPVAQFDQISSSDAFNAWSCTDVGTFVDGVGNQEVQFTLEERPTMVVMKYPHTDGLWQLRDFVMQVKNGGDWETIATMVDAPQNVEQFFFVQMSGSAEKPMVWPIQYDLCGEFAESPVEVQPDHEGFAPTIKASFSQLTNRMLVDMSSEKGLKFAVDGDFGNISIHNPRMHQGTDGTSYTIKQVVVNFPATHRFKPAGAIAAQNADIEAHFIMQKVGSFGVFDLAVVTLLLDLPKETAAATMQSVQFWRQMGLEKLPKSPSPKAIPLPIDFSLFSAQFAGGVSTLKCSPEVDWYLLHEPSYVSGSILHAMKVGPIAADEDECDLLFGKEGAEPAQDLSDDEKMAMEQKRKDCQEESAQRKQAQLELEQSQDAKAQAPL